jgi:hypothetical protein
VLDRRHGFRVRPEKCAQALHVGLAGLGVGLAGEHQLEEVLGRTHDEHRRGHAHDVGGAPVGEVQLHCHAARLAGAVAALRLTASVREAHVCADRLALQMRGCGERTRLG